MKPKRPPQQTPHERFDMLVRDVAVAFARVTGTEPTLEQIKEVEVDICARRGGERYYVPGQPKAQRQAEAARMLREANKRPSQQDLAKAMGISTRGLRKALTGK
jgi:hypothetical protein